MQSPEALAGGDTPAEPGSDNESEGGCWAWYGRRIPRRRVPPAIPLLARTANLQCHMPWILWRTYRSDGSLVIHEVRTKHHEYFRAHRENGRLTLRLVHHQDNSPHPIRGTAAESDSDSDSTAL